MGAGGCPAVCSCFYDFEQCGPPDPCLLLVLATHPAAHYVCTDVQPTTAARLVAVPGPQIEDGKTTQRNVVDSLNVSVASGILLHRLLTAQAPSAASAGSAVTTPAGVDAAAAVAL